MDGLLPRAFAPRRFRRFALSTSCLLSLGLGCATTQQSPPTVEPIAISATAAPMKKRNPKAETCVACADSRLQIIASGGKMANSPDVKLTDVQLTAAQTAQLREEARRAYQQALKIDDCYLPAYHGLAKLYQDMDQYDKAVETYEVALKLQEKKNSLWVRLGVKQAPRQFSAQEQAHLSFQLGMCQARRKQWDSAVANLKKAAELDPENGAFINGYGFCLARAGRYDESYSFFLKAVGEAKAHYNLAQVLHHANRDDECREHLRLALTLKPDLQPAQQLLAQVQGPAIQPVSLSPADAPSARQ